VSDALSALSVTPLPIILVVAGILFWILAIAGSLAGKITVQRSKQRTASLVGTVFIALGLMLSFFVPSDPVLPGRKTKEAEMLGLLLLHRHLPLLLRNRYLGLQLAAHLYGRLRQDEAFGL
jgi:hypothetical protein